MESTASINDDLKVNVTNKQISFHRSPDHACHPYSADKYAYQQHLSWGM